MSIVDPESTPLLLAAQLTAALDAGDNPRAATLADQAADAFLAEQGEPSFDAPNMLRLGAYAVLRAGDHAGALAVLERAQRLAAALPSGDPFDRLGVQLGRLRGEALPAAGYRPGARAAQLNAFERSEATLAAANLTGAVGDDHPILRAAHARLAELGGTAT